MTRRTTSAAALIRTVALVLLTLLAVAGLPAGSALAADTDATWTVRTGSGSYGADRSSYSYTVNPGGRVEDTLVVANRGKAPLTLDLYAADGFTSDAGQLDLLPRAKKSVAVGAWLHTDRKSVEIEPGKSVDVPFTVTVPDRATPGDYVGGVLTALTQPDDAAGINVDRRLGIRVKLRVSGELTPGLAVEDVHVGYSGPLTPFAKGDTVVTYRVHNTGNAVLSARQAVSVAGPFGLLRTEAGKVAAMPDLLPGESRKVTVPVHGVEPGFRLSARVTLTPVAVDASGSTTELEPVRATGGGWAVPWLLTLLVVALAAGIAAALASARRARARRELREDTRVRDAVEQALRDRTP
ncbi:WxL protein peptidoglycan domain-containing protein [Streptomyces sp. NBC_00448]|uniref:WxL protein peptidoglycan domain-containing protein n=1 Tax=Streptomyces sp. NBC_00448 TaxID=2903652 RepID=UPI002E215C80